MALSPKRPKKNQQSAPPKDKAKPKDKEKKKTK